MPVDSELTQDGAKSTKQETNGLSIWVPLGDKLSHLWFQPLFLEPIQLTVICGYAICPLFGVERCPILDVSSTLVVSTSTFWFVYSTEVVHFLECLLLDVPPHSVSLPLCIDHST